MFNISPLLQEKKVSEELTIIIPREENYYDQLMEPWSESESEK
jgi:hypothetical protein